MANKLKKTKNKKNKLAKTSRKIKLTNLHLFYLIDYKHYYFSN